MSIIEVKGAQYDCGKLNAITQFHVVRRLGPALLVAGISIEVLRSGTKMYMQDMVGMAAPIMEFIGKMKDEDVDFVLFSCLGAVRRKAGDQWALVCVPDSKELMYLDIDMPVMVRLVVEVLKENLGPFLTELGDGLTSTSSSGTVSQ